MPSTVIRWFDYHPKTRELEVLFVAGRRYVYSDVPLEEAQRFREAASRGRHFNAYIRDRYLCREMI